MARLLSLSFILILHLYFILVVKTHSPGKDHRKHQIDAMLPVEFNATRFVYIFSGEKFYEFNLDEKTLKNERESGKIFTNVSFPVDAAGFTKRKVPDFPLFNGNVFAINFIKGRDTKIILFDGDKAFIESKKLIDNLKNKAMEWEGDAVVEKMKGYTYGTGTDFSQPVQKDCYLLGCINGNQIVKTIIHGYTPETLSDIDVSVYKKVKGCGAMEVVSDGAGGYQLLIVENDQLLLYKIKDGEVDWEEIIATIHIPTEVFGEAVSQNWTGVIIIVLVGAVVLLVVLIGATMAFAFLRKREKPTSLQEKSTLDTSEAVEIAQAKLSVSKGKDSKKISKQSKP